MAGSLLQRCQHQAKEVLQHTSQNPKTLAYVALFLAVSSWLLVRVVKSLKKSDDNRNRPSTPDLEKPASGRSFKAPPRKPGGTYPIALRKKQPTHEIFQFGIQ